MKILPLNALGYSKIVLNIIWIGVGVIGIIFGLKGFTFIQEKAINTQLVLDSNINTLKRVLGESIDIIETMEQSLATIERSSIDAGLSLYDTRPMINKTSQVVTQDLPLALDEIQTTMPNVINAASMIDKTLYILSMVKFSFPNPLGADFEIGLGIDYEPAITLEESLTQLFSKLDGMPEQMRSLEGDLNMTNTNLETLSDNLLDTAQDIDFIRQEVVDIVPEINQMIRNLEIIQTSLDETIENLKLAVTIARRVYVGLLILFVLNQVPSIYFGYLLTKDEFITRIENIERRK